MGLFLSILGQLIPLYFLILIGLLAAVLLKAQKETIARILIYILATVVVFYGTYSAELTVANLSLPVLFFCLCCLLSLLFLFLGNLAFRQDSSKNILAFSAGTGNTGYFGIPVALVLFGEKSFSLVVLSILGFILFENSLGFFLTAKANRSVRDSLLKMLKLPTLYAFFAGLGFNIFQINLEFARPLIESFKGAYTILGMMIIGMGLSSVRLHHIDYKFISLSLLAKFVVWPLVMLSLIFFDQHTYQFFDPFTYNILLLMGIVPMAANTVAFAAELGVHPDKAALAVLISTLIALFYIPFMTGWLL